MKRTYDNTILLYRIIPEERRVEFIITQNEENAIKSIKNNDIISISFDELLSDIIEFHDSFPKIKAILSEPKELMRKSEKTVDFQLSKLDFFENDSNFLFKYYIERFRSIFKNEHSFVFHEEWRSSKSENTKKRIDILLDNIETITDPEYYSKFDNTTEAKLIVEPDFLIQEECGHQYSTRVILIIQNRPTLFVVSYFTLIDFFNDFAAYFSRLDEHVYKCEHCNNFYFGKKKRLLYCPSPECQKEFRRKLRNLKEVDRTNTPEKKPISSVDNYISTMKAKFKKKVNYDPQVISEFESVESNVKAEIRQEIKRRKIEREPFDDKSMNIFVTGEKNKIADLIHSLISKYHNNNN